MKRKSHLDGVIRLSPAIYFNQPFRNPCTAFSEWITHVLYSSSVVSILVILYDPDFVSRQADEQFQASQLIILPVVKVYPGRFHLFRRGTNLSRPLLTAGIHSMIRLENTRI
uniref:Uncharacterized protein n=1 Tax=Salix viminalis TaxID=40686 RepID=A0A6N2L9J6_SALVM